MKSIVISLIFAVALVLVVPSVTEGWSRTGQDLGSRIAALEAKLQFLATNGTTMTISGANLEIVNGLGATATTNGLGNLTVGYNELRGGGDVRTGSHMVLVGKSHNYSSYGGILAGDWNASLAPWACVSGGARNTASGELSSINGGTTNEALGYASSIVGGNGNDAPGDHGIVSGGQYNTASGFMATVSGGRDNIAGGNHSSVGGGSTNTANGDYASILGGEDNSTSNTGAAVSGGEGNVASGAHTSVTGGQLNSATNQWAAISGGVSNTANGLESAISGGANHICGGQRNWIGGGEYHYAAPGTLNATLSGGRANTSWPGGDWGAIFGGDQNIIQASWATIVGGTVRNNTLPSSCWAGWTSILP